MGLSKEAIFNKTIATESLMGIVLGVVATAISITYALIVFNGDLSSHFLEGITSALIGTIILRLIISFKGSSPMVIAGVQEVYIVIAAFIAADIHKNITDHYPSVDSFPTIMTALMLLTIVFGIWIYIMGKFKLGYFMRFIPYPVFSSFLAATGWLLMAGGGLILGSRLLNFEYLPDKTLFPANWLTIASLVYAYLMVIVTEKHKKPLTFFLFIIAAYVAFYLFLFLRGVTLQQAQTMNLMFSSYQSGFRENIFFLTLGHDFIYQIKWEMILNHIGQYLAFLVIATISLLLSMGSFELTYAHKFNTQKDLKVTGVANIVAGLLGGFAGHIALGATSLSVGVGAKTKLPALISSAVCLIFLLSNLVFLHYFPFFIFAIVAFYLGMRFLYKWIVVSWNQLSNLEHIIQIIIFISTIYFNILVGFVAGILLALILFVFRYSSLTNIKADYSCEVLRSNVERMEGEEEILRKWGKKGQVFILEGYLYFGNFEFIIKKIETIIQKKSLAYIILDFKNVSGIDISAIYGVMKLMQIARRDSVEMIFTNIKFQGQLNELMVGLYDTEYKYQVFSDLDYALEWFEDKGLDQASANKDLLNQPDELEMLMKLISDNKAFTKLNFNANDVIYEMNEHADSFYYVESGTVDVVLPKKNGEVRLRSMRKGTIIGEIGMYLDINRTAIVRANQPCVLLRITRDGLIELERINMKLANELHKQIIKILCKRLNYANHFAPRLQ